MQESFYKTKVRFPLLSGGFGCVAGETKIWNPIVGKSVRIDSIEGGLVVATTNGLSVSTLPKQYNKKNLYKVKTSRGNSIICTKQHRFMTASGWKTLSSCEVGERLLSYGGFHPLTIWDTFRSILSLGARSFLRKVLDWKCRYSFYRRLDDGLLRLEEAIGREIPPSPYDAVEHNLRYLQTGDLEKELERNRLYQWLYQFCRSDSLLLFEHPVVNDAIRTLQTSFERSYKTYPKYLQFLLKIFLIVPMIQFLIGLRVRFYLTYHNHSRRYDTLSSVKFERKDRYYDLHVPNGNNYMAQGFYNHNSGKTLILCHKIMQHLDYPDNYGLLGRLTYQELQDTTQQTFFEVCPQNLIRSYSRSEQRLYMKNGSQLIFRHLDTVSEGEIKSLNLGFFAIDQVEEIPENVFLGLQGRLRRQVGGRDDKYVHQGMMSCNPALFWGYRLYKQEHDPDYELFESSTMDNSKHLPPEYIQGLMKYPEQWKRQYVYGIWDESTFTAKGAYFPVEYIQEQELLKAKPIREFEGIQIFKEMDVMDEYQMGIDPSEGVNDNSAIVVVSKTSGEVVAVWCGKMPADKLATKISQIGRIYRYAKANLEVNAVGMATLSSLRTLNYPSIYKREVFDTVTKKKMEKYGWKTTHANKVLLLDAFLTQFRENKAKLNDDRIIAEMRTFVWTDDANKNGLGAVVGYHDDLIMATALAYWGLRGDYTVSVDPSYVPRDSVLGTLEQIQRSKTKFITKE